MPSKFEHQQEDFKSSNISIREPRIESLKEDIPSDLESNNGYEENSTKPVIIGGSKQLPYISDGSVASTGCGSDKDIIFSKTLENEQSELVSTSSDSDEEKQNSGYPPQDEGYAWVIVVSVFLVMFTTWGTNSAFGVFLSYYLSNNSFDGATKYDYAIIAGFPVALCQLFTPVSIFIMRVIGMKQTVAIGCVLMLLGFLWASFATHLWELYLTQGILTGISMALVSVPPATCVPPWFNKKRAVSMGISLLGTGVGGVVYGPICRKMIAVSGDTRWCYRMLAISCTLLSVIGGFLVKERIPHTPIGFKNWNAVKTEFNRSFDMTIWRRPVIILIAVWYNLSLFAYSLMIYTLAPYAVARGLTQDQGSILTTLLNVAQVVGRPAMGLAGDKWGRRNITSLLTVVLMILTFAFWIPATTYVQLIFFALMVGSCVGVANIMNIVLVADTVTSEEFQPAWGFVVSVGFGPLLVCEVVAQALVKETTNGNPYLDTQIFSGCLFAVAAVLSLIIRENSVRTKMKALQKENDEKKDSHNDNILDSTVGAYFKRMFIPFKN